MVIETVSDLIAAERLGAVATVVEGDEPGMRAVIDESGVIAGDLPERIADDVVADARSLMAREQSKTLDYDGTSVFIETVAPPPRLVIFGAVHVAQPLAAMGKMLGYEVVVADPRGSFATAERFPDAEKVLVGWPDDL